MRLKKAFVTYIFLLFAVTDAHAILDEGLKAKFNAGMRDQYYTAVNPIIKEFRNKNAAISSKIQDENFNLIRNEMIRILRSSRSRINELIGNDKRKLAELTSDLVSLIKPFIHEPYSNDPQELRRSVAWAVDSSIQISVDAGPEVPMSCEVSEPSAVEQPASQLSQESDSIFQSMASRDHEEFVKAVDSLIPNSASKYAALKRQMLKSIKPSVILNEDEMLALYLYTDKYYIPINDRLESGELQSIQGYLKMAQEALRKLPPFDSSAKVTRGAQLNQDQLDLHQAGNYISYRTFISSSVGAPFRARVNTVITIVGSKTGRYIADYSKRPREREVLFSPGAVFKVVKDEKIGSQYHITLEEVSPDSVKDIRIVPPGPPRSRDE